MTNKRKKSRPGTPKPEAASGPGDRALDAAAGKPEPASLDGRARAVPWAHRGYPEGHALWIQQEKGERAPADPADRASSRRRPSVARAADESRLSLPEDLARAIGLEPGAELDAVLRDDGRLEILPNIHSLAKIIVEPTTRCDLSCRTCIRTTWDEPAGDMEWPVFERFAAGLHRFPHLSTVLFGGFGEPTLHPDILAMIRCVKAPGVRVDMVTNGTRLDQPFISGLLDAGLDGLWVSLDGTGAGSYEDIRQGADFGRVVGGLNLLRRTNFGPGRRIDLGISFVLTKRNVGDLKSLGGLARHYGASRVLVTNVLPYSEDMEKEMLCLQTLTLDLFSGAPGKTVVDLPRIDVGRFTRDALLDLFRGYDNLSFLGNRVGVDAPHCRFVRGRTAVIRRDGRIAPCLGLLHRHRTFLYGLPRTIEPRSFGNAATDDLGDAWNGPEYRAFREKVRAFDFSPCHLCGGCHLLEDNREDCYGNEFPVCGGCLWAQGVIQCP